MNIVAKIALSAGFCLTWYGIAEKYINDDFTIEITIKKRFIILSGIVLLGGSSWGLLE